MAHSPLQHSIFNNELLGGKSETVLLANCPFSIQCHFLGNEKQPEFQSLGKSYIKKNTFLSEEAEQ